MSTLPPGTSLHVTSFAKPSSMLALQVTSAALTQGYQPQANHRQGSVLHGQVRDLIIMCIEMS